MKMADHGNICYVLGCAGDVKCKDGLVSVNTANTDYLFLIK